jgi:hypothetical protein
MKTFADIEYARIPLDGAELVDLTLRKIAWDLKLERPPLIPRVQEICTAHGQPYPPRGAWNLEDDTLIIYQFPAGPHE